MTQNDPPYAGFEQGPIRPPSEAQSLLIRITRNCPWNHCTFCPVYKGARFSLRPVSHIKQDIDLIYRYTTLLQDCEARFGHVTRGTARDACGSIPAEDLPAFQAAWHWYANGRVSVFLQDANSLIIKPADLIDILQHLRLRFPQVTRITSYARSHTLARIADNDLAAIAQAGLNRIHIGMESGSDRVLERVRKGADQATHIRAGLKVIQAGMELSEYVMPGLGGRDLSREHAVETARALNAINPQFIRLRTLAIPAHIPLYAEFRDKKFSKLTDRECAQEILWLVEALDGITSQLYSDHILNLIQDLEGRFPADKPEMMGILQAFLKLSPHDQTLYQVGRRMGLFSGLTDLADPRLRRQAEGVCAQYHITPQNVDSIIDDLMRRFI